MEGIEEIGFFAVYCFAESKHVMGSCEFGTEEGPSLVNCFHSPFRFVAVGIGPASDKFADVHYEEVSSWQVFQKPDIRELVI